MAIGVILFMSCKTMKKEEAPMTDVTMPGTEVIRKRLVDPDGDLLRERGVIFPSATC